MKMPFKHEFKVNANKTTSKKHISGIRLIILQMSDDTFYDFLSADSLIVACFLSDL